MSDDKKESSVCKTIDHPNIQGWGCCECSSFNGIINLKGEMRKECKSCGHARCYTASSEDDEPNTNFTLN